MVWTDSDYAGDKQTRKSTSCALVFCDGALVHGHSRRQTVVATSSAEAEYYSLAAGLQEALAARSILQELGETVEIEVKCDSSAARAMANKVGLGRTKHVRCQILVGTTSHTTSSCQSLLLFLPMKTSRTLEPNVCQAIDFKSCVAILD